MDTINKDCEKAATAAILSEWVWSKPRLTWSNYDLHTSQEVTPALHNE